MNNPHSTNVGAMVTAAFQLAVKANLLFDNGFIIVCIYKNNEGWPPEHLASIVIGSPMDAAVIAPLVEDARDEAIRLSRQPEAEFCSSQSRGFPDEGDVAAAVRGTGYIVACGGFSAQINEACALIVSSADPENFSTGAARLAAMAAGNAAAYDLLRDAFDGITERAGMAGMLREIGEGQ